MILDNGRSKILADPELRQTLQCIRCGACLNHCPVYTRLGGHAYGYVYPGPIGSILTPQLEGLQNAGTMAFASTLCGACAEVCPVKIPLTDILRLSRNESYDTQDSPTAVEGHGYKKNRPEDLAWKGWTAMNTHPAFNNLSTRMLGLIGVHLPRVGPLKGWTSVRTAPKFAKKSLHQLAKEEGTWQ